MYTVPNLISDAFYISGVASREFEQVTATQGQDGFNMLNDILTDKVVENDMIPYYTHYTFNAVQGQEAYFIPKLIQLDTLVFFINTVRYEMQYLNRRPYFGSPRATSVQSLPFTFHVERQFGGASIYLYFLPNTAYPMEAWGQFGLSEVTINQDLSLSMDRFYISYLKYALAVRICTEYSYAVPPDVQKQLDEYEYMISKRSQQLDLSGEKVTTLSKGTQFSYAQVNLGRGWSPY